MPKDESWIVERLQQCAKANSSVTGDVVARLKSLLEGKAQERSLTQTELLSTATQLMQDMVKPSESTVGGGNAN